MKIGKRDIKTLKSALIHAVDWYDSLAGAWAETDEKQYRENIKLGDQCAKRHKEIEEGEYSAADDLNYFIDSLNVAIKEMEGIIDCHAGIKTICDSYKRKRDRFIQLKEKILKELGLVEIDPFANMESVSILDILEKAHNNEKMPWENKDD